MIGIKYESKDLIRFYVLHELTLIINTDIIHNQITKQNSDVCNSRKYILHDLFIGTPDLYRF